MDERARVELVVVCECGLRYGQEPKAALLGPNLSDMMFSICRNGPTSSRLARRANNVGVCAQSLIPMSQCATQTSTP